jgi:hypothetical protein
VPPIPTIAYNNLGTIAFHLEAETGNIVIVSNGLFPLGKTLVTSHFEEVKGTPTASEIKLSDNLPEVEGGWLQIEVWP